MLDIPGCLSLLQRWAAFAEKDWSLIPGHPDMGCYGTGYNNWGVQTHQKYLTALAVLAVHPQSAAVVPETERQRWLEQALQGLRFNLASHVSGEFHCTDGARWGHTWISALGIERMMFGVAALEPHLTAADRTALQRVLASEADWCLRHHRRGNTTGVVAGRWAREGCNAPESNLWNGALLWRASVTMPGHPDAPAWREQAHKFLINSVSVAADARDETMVAGRAIRDWTVGDNFFPNYALDHHGYLNVGYMVICVSNAALLHFDLKQAGLERPASLDHHQAELWQVCRPMIFGNGRLARIGGDSRVRYGYCQEYLLPSLLYAADRWQDSEALPLAAAQLRLIETEAAYSGDGSFFSRRLAGLRTANPYYYCRLESDRACVLAMAAWHAERVAAPPQRQPSTPAATSLWSEPEHGAALHRCPTRLASFAWRAHGLTQGVCQPPDDGHLAEWEQNLAGKIAFRGRSAGRRLEHQALATFEGGFLTAGAVMEGAEVHLDEGWKGVDLARHRLAYCALPDGHTVVGLQFCRALNSRVYPAAIQGLHYQLPNDLYNHFVRHLETAGGKQTLQAPAPANEVLSLNSRWAVVDDRLGLMGLYGAESLSVERRPVRRGGAFESLYLESIGFPCDLDPRPRWPGEVLLDAGWAVVASVDGSGMRRFAQANAAPVVTGLAEELRGVTVQGLDGIRYEVMVSLVGTAESLPARPGLLLASAGGAQLRQLGG